MADTAPRDQNHIPTLLAVSATDGVSPVTLYADPITHRLYVDLPAGTGTVTSVSVVTANGISGSVATATTTPAITLTLGAITPTTVNGHTFTTGSSTFTGTAGQTYTFPSTTSTLMANPMTTGGDIIYGGASGAPTRLANGTAGYVLQSNGTTLAPSWVAAGAGDMVLASVQTVTGLKTFDTTKLAVKGSSTGSTAIASANAGATDYTQTLQAKTGTIANSDDVTYIGTTPVALNRASAALALIGITSIDGSAATLTTTRTIWGQNFNGSANVTGDITLGASSITMTGSLAATGARVTKGWFTDIESTNMPTVGGTALSSILLPLAGGTMTGNIQLGENTSVALDPAGSADGKYSGITISGTAGATLAFGDVIVLDVTASKWLLADANSAAAADGDARGLIGMCVLAANDTQATKILLNGTCRADANFPALTITAPVYLSETAGDIVVAQPTTTDVVIRTLGFALTADEIYFNPSADFITHI